MAGFKLFKQNSVREISVKELKKMMDNQEDFQLIDVREPSEYEHVNIEGELIPKATVPNHIDKIKKDVKVVVHCRSGVRSADVIKLLQDEHGFENLYNLAGGILAWSDEIDPSKPKY